MLECFQEVLKALNFIDFNVLSKNINFPTILCDLASISESCHLKTDFCQRPLLDSFYESISLKKLNHVQLSQMLQTKLLCITRHFSTQCFHLARRMFENRFFCYDSTLRKVQVDNVLRSSSQPFFEKTTLKISVLQVYQFY